METMTSTSAKAEGGTATSSKGTAELEIKVTKKDGTVQTYKVPASVENIEGFKLNG
jgi:hypothetical protein